jgi:hypothetical protein
MNKNKLRIALSLSFVFFCISKAYAQSAPAAPVDVSENILAAMWMQVVNNPASLTVIGFLCVWAWLFDDLPFVSSRYVPHMTVILGEAIYWLFAGPSSVPKSFPYPMAVFISNGTLCGFFAFLVHRQIVSRIIAMVRGAQQTTVTNP